MDESPRQPARARRRRLGEMLVDQGVLTQEQLEQVLENRPTSGGSRIGSALVELGLATELEVTEAIASQLGIPAADMAAVDVAPDVLALVDRELAIENRCLPWLVEGRDLFLLMADPTNLEVIDTIGFHTGKRVRPCIAPESEVVDALKRFYQAEEASLEQFANLDLADEVSLLADDEDAEGEERPGDPASVAPAARLVNAVLADAVRERASDIHIEPQTKAVQLRYRVDGMLRNVMTMPRSVHQRIVSRVKIISSLDIAERRRPQDGRAFVRVGASTFDLRVSTLPTADGEKVVCRLLMHERVAASLEELGLPPDVLETFMELVRRPQGMVLVTGPTGSGKTSTLYAAINAVRSETTNMVTIEDPVEYRLAGINQVAVSERAGLTFAAGLRSILRQDPDVIMVGEIRDLETAQIAFQAAQTGHLVLSTLHTNDAASTIMRLVEMGIPAYVVAGSLGGVLAQRLVLELCLCKRTQPDGTAQPVGCESCRFTGFRGRTGVFELMRVDSRISSLLVSGAAQDLIKRAARAAGMRTLYEDGLAKIAAGKTVLDQVLRVVVPDEASDPEGDREPVARLGMARPRVLVVDDDAEFVGILRELLEAEHYQVLTAGDGEQGLRRVYEQQPDLVLTDLRMPRMDGLELLRRLRADLSTCQIPVVFLTVVTDVEAETRALDLGADDYVDKPLERARLLSRVRRALFRAHLLKAAPA